MPWPTLARYNPRAIGVRPSGDATAPALGDTSTGERVATVLLGGLALVVVVGGIALERANQRTYAAERHAQGLT